MKVLLAALAALVLAGCGGPLDDVDDTVGARQDGIEAVQVTTGHPPAGRTGRGMTLTLEADGGVGLTPLNRLEDVRTQRTEFEINNTPLPGTPGGGGGCHGGR